MDTVGDVIKRLQELDPDLPIMKSKDEEGNGFETLWRIQVEKYLKEDRSNTYDLSIVTERDIADGEYGDDPEIGEVVIIW